MSAEKFCEADKMRTRLTLALLVIILQILIVPVIASTQITSPIEPKYEIDIWIDALSTHAIYANYEEDGIIYVDFEVTYGTDVDFFICDSSEYAKLVDGQSYYVYDIHENVGSLSTAFTIPYDDTWYIVFENEDVLFRRHIEGTLSYSAPLDTNTNGVAVGAVIGILVSMAVIGICTLVYVTGYIKTQSNIGQPTSNNRTIEKWGTYCPHCGYRGITPADQFCRKCGHRLKSIDIQ